MARRRSRLICKMNEQPTYVHVAMQSLQPSSLTWITRHSLLRYSLPSSLRQSS